MDNGSGGRRGSAWLILVCAALWAAPGGTHAGNEAVEDIVRVLREQGLINEATEQQILVKNQLAKGSGATPSEQDEEFDLAEGVEWFGDMRIRNEQFWFDDAFGSEASDRNRWRYRARFGFNKQINAWARVGLRLVGSLDHNSTNLTFGDSTDPPFRDPDFGKDGLSIDQAWVEFKLPLATENPMTFTIGKVKNPFIWKNSKDLIIWDSDITPEGMHFAGRWSVLDGLSLFGTLGYYIVDENSSSKDPKLFALQMGAEGKLAEAVKLGGRVSWYEWRSLDVAFLNRNVLGASPTTGGNLPGAFGSKQCNAFSSGFAPPARNCGGDISVAETTLYSKLAFWEAWPLLVYGTYVQNFDAVRTTDPLLGTAGKQDSAWGIGFEIGKASEWFKFGLGYFRVEANATPSRFTDSDLFDSKTNRKGYVAYIERDLAERIKLKLEFFDGEELEDAPLFNLSSPLTSGSAGTGANRRRLRSDIVVEF